MGEPLCHIDKNRLDPKHSLQRIFEAGVLIIEYHSQTDPQSELTTRTNAIPRNAIVRSTADSRHKTLKKMHSSVLNWHRLEDNPRELIQAGIGNELAKVGIKWFRRGNKLSLRVGNVTYDNLSFLRIYQRQNKIYIETATAETMANGMIKGKQEFWLVDPKDSQATERKSETRFLYPLLPRQ